MNGRIDRRRFVAGAAVGGFALARQVAPTGARAQTPAATPVARASGAIAITDVTVIDATGAPPIPHTTVVIEGERIARIGPADSTPAPDGARVVAGAGRFLIPGLWDAHVHAFVFPWQADGYLPLLIANGITGVRDMGGAFPVSAIDEVRSAIASGARVGPRVVAGTMVDGPTPVWSFALRADTADDGREAVAAIADSGGDFVKVYTLLPRAAFLGVADAANARDFPFAGHVPISVTAGEASDAGQRTVEHYSDSMLPYCSTDEEELLVLLRTAAAGPDPVIAYATTFFGLLPRLVETFDLGKAAALAARFAANDTWFTPTLIIGRNAAEAGQPAQTDDPRLRFLPPEAVSAWALAPVEPEVASSSVEIGATIVRAMRDAGAEVLAGTDLGLPYLYPGFSLHDELALLVDAGLTPLEALQAATRNPARAVGRGDDLGTVEAGKLADLVLLEADPLADIANTASIAAVVANGRLFDAPDLDDLLRSAERAAAAPAATPSA